MLLDNTRRSTYKAALMIFCISVKFTLVTLRNKPIMGIKSVASVTASCGLAAAAGVLCDSSVFSFKIAVSTKLLT